MIVLAFDPSTTRTGWALCERVAGRFARLRSGAIKTTNIWPYLERIAELTDAVCDLFDTMPDDLDVIVVEDPGRSRHAIKAAFSVYGVACSWYGADAVETPHAAKWSGQWARAHGCETDKESRLACLERLACGYRRADDAKTGDEGDAICLAMWRLEQED